MKLWLFGLLPFAACVAAITAQRTANAMPQSERQQPSSNTAPSSGPDDVPDGPVDVVIPEPPPPRRYVAIEFNPIPLIAMHTGSRPSDPGRGPQEGLGKLSFNIIVAPFEHHAVVISPFYVLTRTTPITVFSNNNPPDTPPTATDLPIQTFEGFGSELGYRYYTGRGGLRGVYLGPSLILGAFTATAENGDKLGYLNYGFAVDVGYQALVIDRVSLSIGAGLQYTTSSKSIPEQMLWAKVFANTSVFPRLLFSLGWAL
jgi:hypothetical protein